MITRQCAPGSRLLVLLDANMNPVSEVNYGTGKDVSFESVADGAEPLRVEYHNDSRIEITIGE